MVVFLESYCSLRTGGLRVPQPAHVVLAPTFTGTRPGFVFVTGPFGTGYYPDSDDDEEEDDDGSDEGNSDNGEGT